MAKGCGEMSATWDCLRHGNYSIIGECLGCLDEKRIHSECESELSTLRSENFLLKERLSNAEMFIVHDTNKIAKLEAVAEAAKNHFCSARDGYPDPDDELKKALARLEEK